MSKIEYSLLKNTKSLRGRPIDPISLDELKDGYIILDSYGFNSNSLRKLIEKHPNYEYLLKYPEEKSRIIFIKLFYNLGRVRHPVTRNNINDIDITIIYERIFSSSPIVKRTRSTNICLESC